MEPTRHWSERADCINSVTLGALNKFNLPHADLVMLGNAYRSAIAARVDSGQLSAADGELMQAQVRAYLIGEIQQRNAAFAGAASKEHDGLSYVAVMPEKCRRCIE